jgi:hypothetical protein
VSRRSPQWNALLPRFPIFKRLLFNASDAPSDERIDHVVGIAVRTFLAAYQRSG